MDGRSRMTIDPGRQCQDGERRNTGGVDRRKVALEGGGGVGVHFRVIERFPWRLYLLTPFKTKGLRYAIPSSINSRYEYTVEIKVDSEGHSSRPYFQYTVCTDMLRLELVSYDLVRLRPATFIVYFNIL